MILPGEMGEYLSTDINNALSNEVDNTTILNYMLSTDIALTFNNYLTSTQISNTIYTKNESDALFLQKVDTTTEKLLKKTINQEK